MHCLRHTYMAYMQGFVSVLSQLWLSRSVAGERKILQNLTGGKCYILRKYLYCV